MIIETLQLANFRSYGSVSLRLDTKANYIIGENGSGKTNLAEAVYFLSLARSWRTGENIALIKDGEKEAVIRARIAEGRNSRDVEIRILKNCKRVSINGKPVRKLSELSKLTNVILFTPEDVTLFKGAPRERRTFLDIAIAKTSFDYLALLGKYTKVLEERNSILKSEKVDRVYLGVVTKSLVELADGIARYRRVYIDLLNKKMGEVTDSLFGPERKLEIIYHPFIKNGDFVQNASKYYERTLENDILRRTTGNGIHHEDFSLELDGRDIALYGSQGENRLAAIALKILPYFLVEGKERKPIAVLDDIYSELDENHTERLIGLIARLSQVIVTGTSAKTSDSALIEVENNNAIRRK